MQLVLIKVSNIFARYLAWSWQPFFFHCIQSKIWRWLFCYSIM